MTPARFTALCAVLNLGETRIAEMTGYSRGAVKNWGRGHNAVWPPFAAWLERVAPQVQEVLARHPPPNRNRPEAPAVAEVEIAAALRSLPPPLQEPREVRQAAIAAERAARLAPGHTDLMLSPEQIDSFLAANPPPEAPEAIAAAEAEAGAEGKVRKCAGVLSGAEAELAADEAEAQRVLSPAALAFRAEVRRATEPENTAVLSTGPAGEVRVTPETVQGVAQPFKPPIRAEAPAGATCQHCGMRLGNEGPGPFECGTCSGVISSAREAARHEVPRGAIPPEVVPPARPCLACGKPTLSRNKQAQPACPGCEVPAGPPNLCRRCGRLYRTPTCEACA